MTFLDALEIAPLSRPPTVTISVPGSKSITNRAMVLAALAGGEQPRVLRAALSSEDTQVMVEALRMLGFTVTVHADAGDNCTIEIDGELTESTADLFVGNSGTTMRFLTALVSLGRGRFRLDGVPRMSERPIEDLLAALRQLGVKAYSESRNGCPPVIVEADGLPGGEVHIKGDVSSQFLSGLLLAAPLAEKSTTIEVMGPLVSKPYVDMTVTMMRDFGAAVEESKRAFFIPGKQKYQKNDYTIEPDASAASYFFAAAAIAGGRITVPGLGPKSLQGDVRFVDLLRDMGCEVVRDETGITVRGGELHGIDVDMNDISDTVMTLAAVACFADGPTTIRNIAHIRHKETDRLAALAAELRKIGARVEEHADGLKIVPAPLHGASIETYNDHRMAMSLALVGLRVPGIVIQNPGCVAKTYPGFFRDLERLRR
jgi:3-phosphoshikimate 1-carboxyvinyltransferase